MVSNYNQQYNIPMQAVNGQMVPIDREKIKEGVDNSYLANRVKASADEETNPLLYAGTGAAIWYGISQGMDVFNKKCATDYEKSVFGKLGAFGDRVANAWNGTWLGKLFNKGGNKAKDIGHWMTEKNSIAYSLANHSTQPEWGFAKTPGKGVHGFLAMDMQQMFEEYLKPASQNRNKASWLVGKNVNPQVLERYGMQQSDIDAFKKSLKGKTFAQKQLLIQKKELELLGVKSKVIEKLEAKTGLKGLSKLAHNLKVRKLGFNSVADFEAVKKDITAHPEKVMQALENATKNGDVKVSIWKKGGGFGKFMYHMFGREVSFKEYLNKYKAALGKGNSTALGRALPKALSWLLEGCTNRFAGGKIAVAMQAGIFADMLIHTFKAPQGEKGKTLAERFVNDFTYFMAMPLGIVAMHKVGGLKYAGMTTEQVEKFRAAREKFNADVKAGLLADKKVYKARKKDLKNMLKANVKNPITKLFKKIGGFINIGNETLLARRSNAKWNMNFFRKFGNFFRNLAGVPLRIAIPLAIVSPFLAKLTTKGAHAIFGKPTKSVLDEDKEETPKDPQMTPEQQQALQAALIKAAQAQNQAAKVPQSPTNLINQYVNQAHSAQTLQSPIPSSQTNLLNNYVNRQGGIPTAQNTASALLQPAAGTQPLNLQPSVKDAADKLTRSSTAPQTRTYSYIPSPDCNVKPDAPKAEKSAPQPAKPKYIPSPDNIVPPGPAEDYTGVAAAMKKCDDAEKQVAETLAMRW